MTWCSDPLIQYLKSFGYCVVRLPKADVKPLQILCKRGNGLDRLGELTTVLQAGPSVPLPPIHEGIPTANIAAQRTSEISTGIGLSILGGILSAMGVARPGLDTTYRQTKTIMFELQDVLEDKVELAKLDQYLANADVNPFSHYVSELLESDKIYVTTAILKSQKFTVEARRSDGTPLEVSVPEIQGMVGGNVKVSHQAHSASRMTFEGHTPLVFGFQAVQLFYTQGHYSAFEPLPLGIAMRGGSALSNISRQLDIDAPFVRLNG